MDYNGNQTTSSSAVVEQNATANQSCALKQFLDPSNVIYCRTQDVYFYSLAAVIPIGLVCNAFSVVVFLSSATLRRTTTGQYLTVLAAADFLALVGELFRWLSFKQNDHTYYTDVTVVNTNDAACKGVTYLVYAGRLTSAWVTVAITVERLLAVAVPLRVGTICTPRRTRVAIAVICVGCLTLGAYPLWTVAVRRHNGEKLCMVIPDDETTSGVHRLYDRWQVAVDYVGTMALPEALLVVCTSFIIYHVEAARRRRRRLTVRDVRRPSNPLAACDHTDCHGNGRPSPVGYLGTVVGGRGVPRGASTEKQLTLMLIAVCVTGFCLQTPYAVAQYLHLHPPDDDDDDAVRRARRYEFRMIAAVFGVSNHAVNFFLYCLCAGSFRREIARRCLCRCCCRRDRSGPTRGGRRWRVGAAVAMHQLRSRRSVSTSVIVSSLMTCRKQQTSIDSKH